MNAPQTALAEPGAPALPPPEDAKEARIGAIKQGFLRNLFNVQGKFPALATRHDFYLALAYTVRDQLLERWISTAAVYTAERS